MYRTQGTRTLSCLSACTSMVPQACWKPLDAMPLQISSFRPLLSATAGKLPIQSSELAGLCLSA